MRTRPDVLVLGGGGVLGEAWMMGVLAGVEDGAGVDLRDCEAFLGTSAGAVVAAQLAAGDPPRRPSSVSLSLQASVESTLPAGAAVIAGLARAGAGALRHGGGVALTAGAVLAPLALGASAPGGALARALMLRGLPAPTDTLAGLGARIAARDARFDGRLRIVAVARSTGRRTVFGGPGATATSVAEAVQASCAVPWLFAPVTIDGVPYVDGGVWSPTNLDAAPAGRGTHVLCLNPTASLPTADPLLALLHGVARSAAAVEGLVLRRRGARVTTVGPSAEAAVAMGVDFMDAEPRGRVLAAGYRQGLALGVDSA